MAPGELIKQVDPAELGAGAVVTSSGRVSAAKMLGTPSASGPFSPSQLARLDEDLMKASRASGLDISVYLGPLGSDSRAEAERMVRSLGARGDNAVLVAVSPGERVVELVTGATATHRLSQRKAKIVVMTMVATFKDGDLAGGLINGVRMIADEAGSPK